MKKNRIKEAFEEVDRRGFVPASMKLLAGLDQPLPIGHGQTISQPTTVKRMLTWLDPQPGEKILDVGSGSGWTTALLSTIVGEKGIVCAVERITKLVKFGRDNCEEAGIKNVQFFQAGEVFGLPNYAPFDRILVSAAADELPEELLRQIKVGGKLVVPVKHDIIEVNKKSKDEYDKKVHPGYVFVPLIDIK